MAEGFAAIPTWMIRDTRIPRNALLVYAALSSRSGYREIYPSQETIAQESGLTDRTVRKMLKELESLGVLTRQRRRVAGERRAPDGYLLHPNGLPEESSGSSDLPEAGTVSTGNEAHSTPSYTDRESEIDRLSDSPESDAATYLPDEWQPTQKHRDLAASFGANFDRELLRFREHAARTKRRGKNWNAAFTNWLRKGAEMSQQRAVAGGQVRPAGTAVERMAERARAMQAEGVRRELGA